MFQIKKSLFAFVAVAAAFSVPQAFAMPGVDLGIMGGAGMTMPSFSGDLGGATLSGGIGISAGASLGVGPLEVSALYSQYSIKLEAGGESLSSTANYLDIPVLFRMGAGPISFGVGGFYSLFLSDDSGTGDSDPNYGATASVRFTLPVIGFFVDGRYNLGLKEEEQSKISSAAVYLGFNFL